MASTDQLLWYSLGPLLFFNGVFLVTLLIFWITYQRRPKESDVDLKEHSRFLSRFLKEYWYWVNSPVAHAAIRLKLTPNILTVIGLILSCLAGYFFSEGMIALGGWFMIFGATFDMLDGKVARLTGKESKSGAFFDSVMDRFGEGAVFIGLGLFYRDSWILPFTGLALVGSMMVSYARARGEGVGVDVKTGIMQRPERIVYLGVGSIFSPIFASLLSDVISVHYDFMTVGAIVIIAVLANLSALYRTRYVMQRL